jgi:uncharacterized protein
MNDMRLTTLPARHDWRRHRVDMESSGWRHTRRGRTRRSPVSPICHLAEPLLTLIGLRRRVRANTTQFEVSQTEVKIRNLPPEFDGYTILHLTDIHVGRMPGLIGRAVDRLAGFDADLVVMTGDFQSWGTPSAREVANEVARFTEVIESRDGFYGVLGNHDRHDIVEHLETRGVRMLVNEHATIWRDGASLALTGVDDVNYFFTDKAVQTLQAKPAGSAIALVHSPELADIAAEAGYSLYLSGHTHGGQICLPGGVPVFTALDSHRGLASGAWRFKEMAGYTSRGVGVARRARLNCPPEIAIVRLRRG